MTYLDWRSLPEGRAKYQAYLASEDWWARRQAVSRRSGGRCERCGAGGSSVHHLSYEHKYFEPLEDLVMLCEACHAHAHGRPAPAQVHYGAASSRWPRRRYRRGWGRVSFTFITTGAVTL